MKTSIKTFLIILAIGSSYSSTAQYSASNYHSYTNATISQDLQVSLSAKINNNTTYFKLLMKNESKAGVYSMVREYLDGSFEHVDFKNIVPNDVDQPILYCFKDDEIPSDDFTYVLYRISRETEVVGKWNYCADRNELCPENTTTKPLITALK